MAKDHTLDYYIKAYSVYVFEKKAVVASEKYKKSVPEKLKNLIQYIAYYGTEALTQVYTYLAS